MRKFTLLSVLLLLTGWANTWAQTLVDNVDQLSDGTVVALQCRDTNGGPNWYFNGKAVKTENLSYSNLFKIRTIEAGGFALQRMADGTYIGKDGDQLAIKATKAEAAPFTASIAEADGWTTVVPDTENGVKTIRFTTDGTHLNAQGQAGTPKYAGGTGGYSVWYVYTFSTEEAQAMQPYYRFESPRGGFLNANGESSNLLHINENGETSLWKIVLNETGDGVKLYNASQANPLASVNGFTAEGATWYILDNPHRANYKCISLTSNLSANCIDANNHNNGTGTWKPSADDNEGTSWTISEYNPVQDLHDAIETLIEAIGTDPGYIASTTSITDKIHTAQSVLNNQNSTIEEYKTQQGIIEDLLANTDRIQPEAGKFYMIISAYPAFETQQHVKKAMYSDGTNLKWTTLNELDRTQIWTIVPTDGGYTIQNYGDGTYPIGNATTSANFTVGTEATTTILEFLITGQFKVKVGGNPAHCGGHGGGANANGNIVNWNTGANDCSAWYIHEVNEPQGEVFENVTFNYTVNGEVKKSVTGNYDTANPTAPATFAFVNLGNMTFDRESNTVTIPCTYNLPFTASTNFASATWYIMDMHSNDNGTADVFYGTNRYVWTYVDENADVILPQVPSTVVDAGYVPDSRKWAFVGNPFDGFKIYNKAAGENLTLRKATNGNTAAVMSATNDRNVFFLHNTTSGIENSFAWKLADDTDFVNAQYVDGTKVLRGWNETDGGSSCRAFLQTTDIPTGAFYRIKGVANSLYLTTGNINSRMPMIEAGDGAESIFYLDAERKLLNYASGLYAHNTSHTGAIGSANTWEIHQQADGNYILYASATGGNGRYLFNHNAGSETEANRNSVPSGNNTLWIIEPVEALPVTITAAGYSTLYAPVALSLTDGVKAYSGAIEGDNKLMLTETGETVPANTAVVLAAEAGTYHLNITTGGTTVENTALGGAIATAEAPANIYTLQNQDGQVGFFPYTGTNINGFKAYLTSEAAVKGFLFDLGITDGIESVEAATAEKDAVIYDLTGRRVQKAVKGLYIINGKKVIVK